MFPRRLPLDSSVIGATHPRSELLFFVAYLLIQQHTSLLRCPLPPLPHRIAGIAPRAALCTRWDYGAYAREPVVATTIRYHRFVGKEDGLVRGFASRSVRASQGLSHFLLLTPKTSCCQKDRLGSEIGLEEAARTMGSSPTAIASKNVSIGPYRKLPNYFKLQCSRKATQ